MSSFILFQEKEIKNLHKNEGRYSRKERKSKNKEKMKGEAEEERRGETATEDRGRPQGNAGDQ